MSRTGRSGRHWPGWEPVVLDPVAPGRALALQLLDRGPGVTVEQLMCRPAWHGDALCREHPEVDFFDDTAAGEAAARAVCEACPVAAECRAWSMDQGDDLDGVWAGLSADDRYDLRHPRRQYRPPKPAPTVGVGECDACGRHGDLVDVPDGRIDTTCFDVWKRKKRPTGDAFHRWAADRRLFRVAG